MNCPPDARRAARVLVMDGAARLLLLRAVRPDDGSMFWLAPGGGLREGESSAAAAVRETREETGLTVQLGPWVWERRHLHIWDGREHDQYERYFVAHTTITAIRPQHPDGYVSGHCWWTLADIISSTAEFAPRRLRELLPPILQGTYPPEPVDCGV